MKNTSSPLAKLLAVAACALMLGSCNRAEYAMLPKGSSYHGVSRMATPVPAAPAAVITPAATEVPATAPAASSTPETRTALPAAVAAKPAAAPARTAPVTTPATVAATTTATPAPKLSLVQRLALSKVTRQADKLIKQAGSVRQHDNSASVAKGSVSGNLRIGIILLLVGLIVSLINGFIGSIIALIGLIFIVLWLLDQL
ncbi:hypothetical protein [Hymenobacter rubidus]|uniref:hypothetical protein n=1 Tax=Hymenobacter rubidus TaxID=1441626 RepID=UPI00191E783F|nr:hypothetical protein [Hymenobacter rubidus]